MVLLPGCACCGGECDCACLFLAINGRSAPFVSQSMNSGQYSVGYEFLGTPPSDWWRFIGSGCHYVWERSDSGWPDYPDRVVVVMPDSYPGVAKAYYRMINTQYGYAVRATDYEVTVPSKCYGQDICNTLKFSAADVVRNELYVTSAGSSHLILGEKDLRFPVCNPPTPSPGASFGACVCEELQGVPFGRFYPYWFPSNGTTYCQETSYETWFPSYEFSWCGLTVDAANVPQNTSTYSVFQATNEAYPITGLPAYFTATVVEKRMRFTSGSRSSAARCGGGGQYSLDLTNVVKLSHETVDGVPPPFEEFFTVYKRATVRVGWCDSINRTYSATITPGANSSSQLLYYLDTRANPDVIRSFLGAMGTTCGSSSLSVNFAP